MLIKQPARTALILEPQRLEGGGRGPWGPAGPLTQQVLRQVAASLAEAYFQPASSRLSRTPPLDKQYRGREEWLSGWLPLDVEYRGQEECLSGLLLLDVEYRGQEECLSGLLLLDIQYRGREEQQRGLLPLVDCTSGGRDI